MPLYVDFLQKETPEFRTWSSTKAYNVLKALFSKLNELRDNHEPDAHCLRSAHNNLAHHYRLNKNKEYVSLLCTSDIEDAMHRLELAEARDDKEES